MDNLRFAAVPALDLLAARILWCSQKLVTAGLARKRWRGRWSVSCVAAWGGGADLRLMLRDQRDAARSELRESAS